MFLNYLLIVTGAHLDILAMRLIKLGENAEKSVTESSNDPSHHDGLIDCINVYSDILKLCAAVSGVV